MPVANLAVAAALEEIADRLDIQGANAFRIRAYRTAARMVRELPDDVAQMAARGESLEGRRGIGADLAGKITQIATTGTCGLLRNLRSEMPPAITDLLQVPGLGPKRVKTLWHELGVETAEQVVRAAHDRRIRAIHGFGEKMEQGIASAVSAHLSKKSRIPLAVAAEHATALLRHVASHARPRHLEVAGSFRRRRETVGDLDVLAAGGNAAAIVKAFVGYPDVDAVLSHGATRAAVRLHGGLQVDLRVVPETCFGSALAYFTGSKAHNIAIRRLGQERGLKINEYGVYRGSHRIAGDTETSVYAAVGLPLIPPELREDRGEIAAAREGRLPRLVELADLRGDLHAHTRATDGRDSLVDMVAAARARGYEYLAITEHSRHQAMSHGLDAARLGAQAREIAAHNGQLPGFCVLHGIEVDILSDGSLDLPDEVLAPLDLVVAAVHGAVDLDRARQTQRILAALEHPAVSILAHPTGRLIGKREPYDLDMLAIIRKAKALGVHLELNAHPERLDLTDTHLRMCRDEGVRVAISSDAHSVHELANIEWGVGQARRGWLARNDVLNSLPLHALDACLRRAPRERASAAASATPRAPARASSRAVQAASTRR
jgi:DNA polymerase (family 10)